MKNYCARCGKENKGKYKHRSKYCSLKCAYNTERKKCLNCEKIFDGRKRDKHCSKNCIKEFNFKNPREIITKSFRQGSNKLNLDTYKHPVFGFKYIKNADKNNRDYAPSLDRINPKKGYTKENVIVVSFLANRIKTDASIEQIGKVYKFYKMLLKNNALNKISKL